MKRQQGFTLIELIVFIIVVSVGVLGILSVFSVAVKGSGDPVIRKQSISIAEALLDEILAKDFSSGGYSGTDRLQFDDVSDYAGYHQVGITSLDGSPVSGLENYTLDIAVDASSALGIAAGDIKKVTVSVTVDGDPIELTGYRANYE
jgi:MSHA pilin protein MshD